MPTLSIEEIAASIGAARVMAQREATGSAIKWEPLPGPQTAAYESPADIIGYGGAAGGGKSYLMLGLAITRHRHSLILRRERTQVRDLWSNLVQLIGTLGRTNENYLVVRDLPGDRTVELGGLKDPGDWKTYQGRPYDLHAFDELTEFTEQQFRTLIAWNRTTTTGQRCQVVGAFNPPTSAEGEWVIRYFAPWLDGKHPHPAEPGELRWYAMVKGDEVERDDGTPFEVEGEIIQPKSRTFFPARVTDNPLLVATGYVATLQSMPEPLRSQMLFGDFTAGRDDNPWQVIPTDWVRQAQDRWTPDRPSGSVLDTIGVDVARGGADQTVLSRRYGRWFAPLEKHAGKDTPDGPAVAQLVISAVAPHCRVRIDGIGVGASVYDFCRRQVPNTVSVQSVIVSEAAPGRDRTGTLEFANLRAFLWWALREALDPETGDGLMLPPDSELLADLCAPRWSPRASGILVEAKEDIRKRLGRSTDFADPVVLALESHPHVGLWDEDEPADVGVPLVKWGTWS